MSKPAPAWLSVAGQLDGAVAAVAATIAAWASFSPTVTKDALLVAGVAGGIGFLLNAIAQRMGDDPVAPQNPPAPPPAAPPGG